MASLTSLANMDNLKTNIFPFSVTVSPDDQGLALPCFSFQSFLEFPIGGKIVRTQSPDSYLNSYTTDI